MAKKGKKFKAASEQVEDREYPLGEAVPLLQKVRFAGFDESVEIALRLGVNPKHADQIVRGVCMLPNGSGRTARVAVFARGPKADEAKEAGADCAKFQHFLARDIVSDEGFRSLGGQMAHQAAWKQSVYDIFEKS